MHAQEERGDSPLSLKIWPVIVPLVAIPSLYVLSIGPAVMLRNQGVVSQQTLRWIYAPLFWLDSRSSSISQALEWYVQLWV